MSALEDHERYGAIRFGDLSHEVKIAGTDCRGGLSSHRGIGVVHEQQATHGDGPVEMGEASRRGQQILTPDRGEMKFPVRIDPSDRVIEVDRPRSAAGAFDDSSEAAANVELKPTGGATPIVAGAWFSGPGSTSQGGPDTLIE